MKNISSNIQKVIKMNYIHRNVEPIFKYIPDDGMVYIL